MKSIHAKITKYIWKFIRIVLAFHLCLCWGLTSQSTIFQSCRDGATASWVINQYFRGVKCLAQGHNTAAVGIEPLSFSFLNLLLALNQVLPDQVRIHIRIPVEIRCATTFLDNKRGCEDWISVKIVIKTVFTCYFHLLLQITSKLLYLAMIC